MGSSGNDFARQLAERNAELNVSNGKKFRSSAAPKGSKLRSGYQDRTQLRTSREEDDKATRVKALEDMVKLGQIDLATFEALRDEIVGGDVRDVHLVKGLDYKLLERVRRGEDVLADSGTSTQSEADHDATQQIQPEADVDGEFEKMEERAVQPIAREQTSKKGEMAPPPVAGQKRTRDDILKELKASRLAAAESARQAHKPALGPRFMKVGEKKERPKIEKDERGREVLISIDEDGRVKKKVRKAKVNEVDGLLMPDKDAKPLGMEVTPIAPPVVPGDEDEGDIFEGVGVDYNPLGGVDDDDSNDSNDSEGEGEGSSLATLSKPPPNPSESETSSSISPPSMPQHQSPLRRKRNYFGDSEEEKDATDDLGRNPLTDPTILAALKKASAINPFSTSEPGNEEAAAKLARRKRMLELHDRDADDIDIEFGSSRFGDAEDAEERKVKLSVWGGDGGEAEGRGEGKEKRKRGAKKRKGDINSAADVLKVMERRRGEGK